MMISSAAIPTIGNSQGDERAEVGGERRRKREDRRADRAVESEHECPAEADPARELALAQSWNFPTITVTQWPPRMHAVACKPAMQQAGALARLERGEALAAEALGPIRHQRGVRRPVTGSSSMPR